MATGIEAMPKYCCGCNSRIATLFANILLLITGCLYFGVGLSDINSKTKPNVDERLFLEGVLVVTAIQFTIAALAIWGACNYRGWPVMLSLGWATVNMILVVIGSVVNVFISGSLSRLVIGLIGFLIQFSCIWMPQYGTYN